MHANNNRANITLAEPLNDLEAINALSEYCVRSIITKLQLIGQQLMKLLFSRAQHPTSFVAGDPAFQSNPSLLSSHCFKSNLIFSVVASVSVINNFSCISSFSSGNDRLYDILYP